MFMTPQQPGYWGQRAVSSGGCFRETPCRHIGEAHESRPAAAESKWDGQGLGRPYGEGCPGPGPAPLSSRSTGGAAPWGHSGVQACGSWMLSSSLPGHAEWPQ